MQPIVEKRVRMNERYSKKVSAAETQQKPDKVKESKVKKSKVKNTPQNNGQKIDPLKTVDFDIKNFRKIGMTDQWIKDHYLNIGINESQIDIALGKNF